MADSPLLEKDPLWYQKAVIYQVNVRSFFDADGNGIGDFKGIEAKLDYLQALGVNALWLMPFYPSPLRDDGYDISNYLDVNPMYGKLEDIKDFIQAAHARGLRVITELIINHTSDQHPWFQAARKAPKGSPERDFYVWSDDPAKYGDARIIFKDYEPSNWTWDEVAGQYFWHRFFHHQPDLNFDNPAVHQAVFDTLDFWMDMGVDGFRLDAIPYLYEREGTTGENLPETHEFLKKLRAHLDANYQNKMLLAEANQWPEDTRPYFGDGDECHMNYNFPIMPRMYMSVMQEDRFPLMDILSQTPEIPAGCQWAMFLRNHDELTLEMVTEEERHYMWRNYSPDPRGRINLGIRRRIFPLMNGDRERVRLLNCLLLSFPGTPVLYYGDEIGMGDNLELDDRFGVRTPMQWSDSKNAGFSEADESQLLLPVITDPKYAPAVVNVEIQENDPHSQLNWTRRILNVRNQHPVFGNGEIEFLQPENQKVIAYLRTNSDEQILVIANLSASNQRVDLDLSAHVGATLSDLISGTSFGVVDAAMQRFTLAPHQFYWLQLNRSNSNLDLGRVEKWTDIFDSASSRNRFELALTEYLSGPDYAGTEVTRVRLLDAIEVPNQPYMRWVLADAEIPGRETETYILLFGLSDYNSEAFAKLNFGNIEGGLFDLTLTEEIAEEVFEFVKSGKTLSGLNGKFEIIGELPAGDPVIRIFSKTGVEPNPAWELGAFLAGHRFENAFGATALVQHVATDGASRAIAVVESGDANAKTLADLIQVDATMPISDVMPKVGRDLAKLHALLAAAEAEGMRPIAFTSHYQRSVYQSIRSQLHRTALVLKRDDLLAKLDLLNESLNPIKDNRIDAKRIRVHGNLDANRVYLLGPNAVFMDFSGGAERHLAERRLPVSALSDLARLKVDLRIRYRSETALDTGGINAKMSELTSSYFAAATTVISEGESNAQQLLRGYELMFFAKVAEKAAGVGNTELVELAVSEILAI